MDILKKLGESVENGAVHGVIAAAATDKGMIFEGAAGGLKTNSVIWIASMTKAITGAAAMQLVERGKLSLDAPAADVLPEIAKKQVLVGIEGIDSFLRWGYERSSCATLPSAPQR